MVLWIVLAILTAGVAAILILPFARSARAVPAEHAGEIAVYRDQLKELERDQGLGLIDAQQADYARAEIGRRLLAAADADAEGETSKPSRYGFTTVFVTLLLPATGLCLYLMLGSPNLPAQPLEARLANPGNNIALLVAKAERHLAQNPSDGAGWDLLAPIYYRSMRLGDAELAYRNAIRLMGASPARLAGLGETLVAASDGVVTEDARVSFEEALRLQPDTPNARFYIALALEQSGKRDEARTAFEALAKDSPADAPWMELVSEHIARNGGTVPPPTSSAPAGPTQEEMRAAQQMSESDRRDMIRGMVESLAAKMQEDPNNLEGWLQLTRSYAVLGDREKAEAALKSGLKQFPGSGELVALAQQMGIAVEGVSQ
ncbi:c-type cytochrome biogenesis protein CcmI [Rhizobium sp. LC145]|uniref:c-type cytochrome biogenesis protein CcmI n=1 Tax=Rhizobium sp. LC145 TaxID=1120688 RepID=UPI000629E71B|nr:c-type cytochrome biogenesis protein CcmI [Rhizobium sp. LC145]KKX28041.1 cytochrome C biogenesis protein CycH [Rhizobium sp. LC145]TKT43080.1 c-type cytochrome biogenesis protein CcmI [Rhizobiaceae bacterium LC148]